MINLISAKSKGGSESPNTLAKRKLAADTSKHVKKLSIVAMTDMSKIKDVIMDKRLRQDTEENNSVSE